MSCFRRNYPKAKAKKATQWLNYCLFRLKQHFFIIQVLICLHSTKTINDSIYFIQHYKMKVIIAGGGIGGLVSALSAKKVGHLPLVFQKTENLNVPNFGGGIGLWPTSQAVLKRLDLLEQVQEASSPMPSAAYYNKNGEILGKPSNNFAKTFPVLCLERKELTRILIKACQDQQIELISGSEIVEFEEKQEIINSKLSDGSIVSGQVLIGADGINSKIRSQILIKHGLPQKYSHHCGYAYFRAVISLENEPASNWHEHSFESWGNKKRFGFVPLKYPKVFWFVAIPIGEQGLEQYKGSHVCDQERKQWILKQFSSWKSPIDIQKLLKITPASTILRTDIRKIEGVTKFPWVSPNERAVLIGDSANATAPNLAQGAGLAIQSSWDFFSSVNLETFSGLDEYIVKRKKRAYTVQTMADMVARVGQASYPYSEGRDSFMAQSTEMLPRLEQRIFQAAVRYSLGGTMSSLYWNCPPHKLSSKILSDYSLLCKIIGHSQYEKLTINTQQFRNQLIGDGNGKVTVEVNPIGKLLGLPTNMTDQYFVASIQSSLDKSGNIFQKWTRVFGQGTSLAKKFKTYHHSSILPDSGTGLALTQTLGIGPDIFRFGYNPIIQDQKVLYTSNGLWLRNIRLPIPSYLLPSSSWVETQNKEGWMYSGQINFPQILGGSKIMKYYGDFRCNKFVPFEKKKTVVITGGSGMLGTQVCKMFYKDGWNVIVLSRRKTEVQAQLPYCKVQQWKAGQNLEELAKVLQKADAVINLAGENPGGGLWTGTKKQKILGSRIRSLHALSVALNLCSKQRRRCFIQASAAGIYGNRGDQVLKDDSVPGNQDNFRVSSCKILERQALKLIPQAVISRIGHVLSSQGGLYPFIKLGSTFGVAKLGQKPCYIPWVHVEDVASAFLFIANNKGNNLESKTINLSSPEHATYANIFDQLAQMKGRKSGYFTIPQILLRKVMGEISSVILESQRMQPQFIQNMGFVFNYPSLRKAISSEQCL